MLDRKVKVLMTGAGAPGAAGIIRCLQQADWIRLITADANEFSAGRFLASDFMQIPAASESDFTDRLFDLCVKKEIDLVLPLVTRELWMLAKAKERFAAAGIQILVSDPDSIERSNDKASCYRFLKEAGIMVPAFHSASTVDEFIRAAFQLGHPEKPFCFKPAVSNGSRGVRIVRDTLDESDLLFNHKPYHLSITYTHAIKILSSKAFPPLVVSEYLPGMEYSVDCLAYQGEAKLVVPRTRERMINGISVQGCFEQNAAIMDYCTQIISALNLNGNIGIQVKLTAGNEPRLLEINPRVQGTIAAGLGAGINLPLLAIKQALGVPIGKEETTVRWGTSFIRYWNEVFF